MSELVKIRTEEDRVAVVGKAAAMLAQARTPADAKKVADLAKAAEMYARLQEAGEEAVSHARAICVDALALMGEMLKAVEKNVGAKPGKTGSKGKPVLDTTPTLAEQGIPKKQSMHAQALATVKERNPDLYERVRAGKASIASAHVEVKRQKKREELIVKAEAIEEERQDDTAPDWQILRGEVGKPNDPLALVTPGSARLVFADPPYNIGIDYGEGHDDAQTDADFLAWCEVWMTRCRDLLTPDGAMWVLISDDYAGEFAVLLKKIGLHRRNWVVWYETFGVNCTDKFNRTKRHLFYCTRDPRKWVFNFDAVKCESARQKIGDARANPSGKTLDDVWTDIPRLAGVHPERIPDFPTQLPIALLRRIVNCCAAPGDLVIDPFNGSGTTGVAAIERGCRYVGVERSSKFADLATLRLKAVKRGNAPQD